jgi:hypothetical protein
MGGGVSAPYHANGCAASPPTCCVITFKSKRAAAAEHAPAENNAGYWPREGLDQGRHAPGRRRGGAAPRLHTLLGAGRRHGGSICGDRVLQQPLSRNFGVSVPAATRCWTRGHLKRLHRKYSGHDDTGRWRDSSSLSAPLESTLTFDRWRVHQSPVEVGAPGGERRQSVKISVLDHPLSAKIAPFGGLT